MPLIAFPSGLGRCSEIQVPGAVGLNVFLIQIGIFLWHTGYIVGGYILWQFTIQ